MPRGALVAHLLPALPWTGLMPNTPGSSRPDPMSREVDRLLAQLNDVGSDRARDPQSRDGVTTSRPTFRSRARANARPKADSGRYDSLALWGRIALGGALGGVITQWPYPRACGWPLIGYLGAVATVMLAGGWIAVTSWKQRDPIVHLLSLILVFWGIVLAAEQVLPRIGYAAVGAGWRCGAGAWLPFLGI
jgi:hypothetical protein